MMEEFTAKMAQELTVLNRNNEIDAELKYAFERIKDAAKNGQTETRLISEFWCKDGYSKTKLYCQAVSELERLGYAVEFFYEDKQFANFFTIVSWVNLKIATND